MARIWPRRTAGAPAASNEAAAFAEEHLPDLTPRQREVLDRMAEGLSNPQIAERLGISLDGAKHHVSEVLTKLGFASREEATAWWRGHQGLAGMPSRIRRRAPVFVAIAAAGIAVLAVGLLFAGMFRADGDAEGSLGPLSPGLWIAVPDAEAHEFPSRSRIRLFNPETNEERIVGSPERYSDVMFAPDGSRLLVAISSGAGPDLKLTFRVVPVDGGPEIDPGTGEFGGEMSSFLGFTPHRSPDGRYLASTVADLVIMEVATGRLVARATPFEGFVDVGWSANSQWFTVHSGIGDDAYVFGVDGSQYPANAAPPAASPLPGDELSPDLVAWYDAVRANHPGMTALVPPPYGSWRTAEGSGAVFRLISPSEPDQVVAMVDGREIAVADLDEFTAQMIANRTYDAVIIR